MIFIGLSYSIIFYLSVWFLPYYNMFFVGPKTIGFFSWILGQPPIFRTPPSVDRFVGGVRWRSTRWTRAACPYPTFISHGQAELGGLPPGEHTKSNGKSPFFMGKLPFLMGTSPFLMGTSPFSMGKSTINFKWPFSSAMLVHQSPSAIGGPFSERSLQGSYG